MTRLIHQPDPELDLMLERIVDISPAQVWAAWTEPDHITQWFTPAPWKTVECEIDLWPGGQFRTVMRSPEGQDFHNSGCYLEIVENEILVWTNAVAPGFRPADKAKEESSDGGSLVFTAIISLEAQADGTRYTALAMHADPATRKRHEAMGFHDGWGKALDQLVAHMKE